MSPPERIGSHRIRIVTIKDRPWFVAADVRTCLSISQGGNNYRFLSEDEVIPVPSNLITGKGGSNHRLLSESGLYKFILRSDKPEAKVFQDWVTRDVLPAIRKDRGCVMGGGDDLFCLIEGEAQTVSLHYVDIT